MGSTGDALVRRGRRGSSNGGSGLQTEAVASARRNKVKRSHKSTAPVEHSDGGHRTERMSLPGERGRSGMSPSSNETGRAGPTDPSSEQRLLNRVRRGRASAVAAFTEALKECTRARVPFDWAATQSNFGVALMTVGERGRA